MSSPRPTPVSPSQRRVAASLITYKRTELLIPMLESLAASDAKRYNVTVFYWMNDYNSPAAEYMRNFHKLPTVAVDNPTRSNQMIVIPRINIMDAVLATKDFDWLLELHDDMRFPRVWLEVCFIMEPRVMSNTLYAPFSAPS